jgi:hypothetical protein|uniref:Uncharacterized protein n=1 Tax=Prymnesium polylepis TaxID=72548 RepID=A0A7S4M211_9EUKA|mmetsp:Transcript_11474/g.28655  ORF Transcript_11474/g.28655 Transcript_11474/m.28655 type:complete len:169 (+) Transcript_11474:20-526(+)
MQPESAAGLAAEAQAWLCPCCEPPSHKISEPAADCCCADICTLMGDDNVLAATAELLPALVAAAEAIATSQRRSSRRRLFALQQLGIEVAVVPLFAVFHDGVWLSASLELQLAWRRPGGAPGEVLEHNQTSWDTTVWTPEDGDFVQAAMAPTCAAHLARFLAEPPPMA